MTNNILPTIELTNEFCDVLTEIERTGMKVDISRLDRIQTMYEDKLVTLKAKLQTGLKYFMGDTPINLDSPEQMSKVLYSRSINKSRWQLDFGLATGMPQAHRAYRLSRLKPTDYVKLVQHNTTPIYKTQAIQCKTCQGTGRVQTRNKDGSLSKRPRICNSSLKNVTGFKFKEMCGGTGYILLPKNKVAGLGLLPRIIDVAASGWASNKSVIEYQLTRTKEGTKEHGFLKDLLNYNIHQSRLTSLIPGIRRGLCGDMLHTTFNQSVTATGRLSSKNPNVQNFPRGTTFYIKEIFVSRWGGGKILEVDYSGLEFVAAVELSQDRQGIQDVLNKEDKHTYTRTFLAKRGERMSRTEAKVYTFKPLYGGSSGTKAQQAYFSNFYELHPDIAVWHKGLVEDAIGKGRVTLPTGRYFDFSHVARTARGCTYETQVKNYPVQGFATADIVPCAVIAVYKALKDYNSCIINTVHDSVIVDIHPKEVDIIPKLVYDTMRGISSDLKQRYGYQMTLPLRAEVSLGANWYSVTELVGSKFNED